MVYPVHLNALRAFEVSARHQSFSAAAKELNVTPAAVGQLVRGLEDWLGSPLFIRKNSGPVRLIPTEVALNALPEIRQGLEKLNSGLEILKQEADCKALSVTVSPAFAAKWLLPRYERFQLEHADIELRLETSLTPIDFVSHQIDIGVRYGKGQWSGLIAEKLMDEEVYPVCSPAFYQASELQSPEDLKNYPLIQDLSLESVAGFPSWETWFKRFGVAQPAIKGIKINNSSAVLQAAIDGQGIALARSVMAKDDLKTGRLIRLFPEYSMTSDLAYYVVYREGAADSAKLAVFKDWLHNEATL